MTGFMKGNLLIILATLLLTACSDSFSGQSAGG